MNEKIKTQNGVEFKAEEFKNVKEIICNSAKKYGEKSAFVIKNKHGKEFNYTNITFNKFLEDINALGTSLYSIGLQNSRIAIVGKNRYEWILTHISNLFGGIVSVPLDKDLQLEELENSLIRSKAKAIVFDSKLLETIKEIKERNNTEINNYICMDKIERI